MTTQSCSETDQETPEPWCKQNEFDQNQQATETRSKKKATRSQSRSDVWLNQSSAVVSPLIKENIKTPDVADHQVSTEDNGRGRLKRHRVEVAGQVWIPDIWGQEELLKDWIDCSVFDASVLNASIMSARAALVEEGRRAHSIRLRIEESC